MAPFQFGLVRLGQGRSFLLQALAPRFQLLHGLAGVTAVRFLDLQRLFRLRQLALQVRVFALTVTEYGFHLRQALPLLNRRIGRFLHLELGQLALLAPMRETFLGLYALLAQLTILALPRAKLADQAAPGFTLVLQLLLQPGHLGIGGIELALSGMKRISGGKMLGSGGF